MASELGKRTGPVIRAKRSQDSTGDYGAQRANNNNSIWSKKQGSLQGSSANQNPAGTGPVVTASSAQRSSIVDDDDKKFSCVSQSIHLAERSKARPKPAVAKKRQKKAVLLVEFEFGVPSPRQGTIRPSTDESVGSGALASHDPMNVTLNGTMRLPLHEQTAILGRSVVLTPESRSTS